VTAFVVAHQERLCSDPGDVASHVGKHQTRKLEATLVDHVPARRRRPVKAGKVALATVRADRPPRDAREDESRREIPQRHVARCRQAGEDTRLAAQPAATEVDHAPDDKR
jgi:hypothetical protein